MRALPPQLPRPSIPGQVVDFCKERGIDLVVVGPEAPLVAGLADALGAAGVRAFGPSAAAAQLEGSKKFMKVGGRAEGCGCVGVGVACVLVRCACGCWRGLVPSVRVRVWAHRRAPASEQERACVQRPTRPAVWPPARPRGGPFAAGAQGGGAADYV
jgi:hypothetical protein